MRSKSEGREGAIGGGGGGGSEVSLAAFSKAGEVKAFVRNKAEGRS